MRFYAIIEWYRDSSGGERPSLVTGPDADAVRAGVVGVIAEGLGEYITRDGTGSNFLASYPYPDVADPVAVETWLGHLSEWVTDAVWVTMYEPGDVALTEV